ncbi:MAG: hypothetical protein ACI822_002973, partial [Gammaproteobacteria bacterium]
TIDSINKINFLYAFELLLLPPRNLSHTNIQ